MRFIFHALVLFLAIVIIAVLWVQRNDAYEVNEGLNKRIDKYENYIEKEGKHNG